MPVRVAVTGVSGQLGRALVDQSDSRYTIQGISSAEVDIRDWTQVRDWLAAVRPHFVVHGAAMTDVDGCESKQEEAFAVNALGARHVAAAASRVGATVVYISTNFVFDGRKTEPHHEFDKPNPISVYGASKLAGEREVLVSSCESYIVRTAMVYDESGRNFVNTMRRLMQERDSISVVADQTGNPTYAPDLAIGILRLIESQPPGLYHITNTGSTTWHGWAAEIKRLGAYSCEVLPIDAASYERAASPPDNGTLRSMAWPAVEAVMPHWTDALARCLR